MSSTHTQNGTEAVAAAIADATTDYAMVTVAAEVLIGGGIITLARLAWKAIEACGEDTSEG
jgi:hypothetical protein